jgi:hypothetical protein
MSKKNNVNPDHYKVAGRERQGEDIIHGVYKRKFAQSKSQAVERQTRYIPGTRQTKEAGEGETKKRG